jgi:predicted O-methyltransferase YrrM
LNLNYKSYWRKTGLKGKWGNIFLDRLNLHNPKNVLEIGVFCGVTARNICDLLNKINRNNFNYIGVDLFGNDQNETKDEIKPTFLKDQKFSNPLKNIYYNYILKENLNSIKSVKRLLKKYSNNIKLIAGDTNKVLKEIDLQNIDFVFLDGGHSYQTVINDLTILYDNMKNKKKIIFCDDYGKESYIPEVEKAINDFTNKNNLKINLIKNRFAEIVT